MSWHCVSIPEGVAWAEAPSMISEMTHAYQKAGMPSGVRIYVDPSASAEKRYYLSPIASQLLVRLEQWNDRMVACGEPHDFAVLKLLEL